MAVSLTGMSLLTNNDSETSWAGTEGPDQFGFNEQGSNSESWFVSKNATENGVLTLSANMPASRGLYIAWLASSVKSVYTGISLELQDSASDSVNFTIASTTDRAVDGAFRAFAFDYVNKGTQTGTFDPTALSTSTFTISMANQNVRNTPNHWIDAIYYGPGHTVGGTTTNDKLFFEAWDLEYNNAASQDNSLRYGVLENFNGIIFCQADLDLSGTALVSSAETLVFADSANGYDVYNLDVTGTVTFTNTNVQTAGTKQFNLDTSTATSFSMTGGALEGGNTLTISSGNTFDSVVVSNSALVSINTSAPSCQFINNTLITLGASGSLSDCAITPSAATTVALATADLNSLTNCRFIGDNTGHAVELTNLGTGTMDWDCTFTGFDSGSLGTTTTNTGNEAIFVDVASGSLEIIVAATATIPSVRSSGANITVSAPQATLTVTNVVPGSDVVIKASGTTTILQDDQDIGASTSQYTYTYQAGTFVDVIVYAEGYVPFYVNGYELGSSDASLPASQAVDRNFVP